MRYFHILIGVKKGVLGLLLLFTFSYLPSFAATTPKPGSSCAKQGITKAYKGKKYTCIKSGRKLVWNKGVLVKKAAPQAIPKPTLTSKPTPTPTATPTATLDNIFENDPVTQKIEAVISNLQVSATKNKTSVAIHVEDGKNGNYPEQARQSVEYSLKFFASLLTPLTQNKLDLILWRTENWFATQIPLYAPLCKGTPVQTIPHNGSLCASQEIAAIGTNLATVVSENINSPRDIDISNLVMRNQNFFAAQSHETFHNWQASLRGWELTDTPTWLNEGMAVLMSNMALAKHSNESKFFTNKIPKMLDPDGYSQKRCVRRIEDLDHYCSYFQGMYVSQYFLYKFGVEGYIKYLRDSDRNASFETNFKSATLTDYSDFKRDANIYLKSIKWQK